MRKLARKNRANGERGQSMVEFALIVPLFLILVFGIVDFGMGFHAWLTVTNAAREGARLGAVGGTATQIEDRVRDTSDTIDQAQLTVSVTNAQGNAGESVVVDVDYEYNFITPLSGLIATVSGNVVGPTITFATTAEMRLE